MTAKSQLYQIRVTFRAPMNFAFRWCTDYRPDDAMLEGEKFQRRIVKKSKRQIVYEDLDNTPDGWMWSRWTISLHPPSHWHGESIGNYRAWNVDYRLKPLGTDRTLFTFHGRRTPMLRTTKNPSKTAMERDLKQIWKRFGRNLESDYRRSLRAKPARAGRGRRR